MERDRSVVSRRIETKHTHLVAPRSPDLRLGALTRLGHSLPGARNPEEAAAEVVAALASLDVAGIVSAIESDMAVVLAINIPPSVDTRLSPRLASTMVGMRIPLDGVESLRKPVRLRRPYFGAADASETLRRLTTDSTLAKALPNAADERDVIAVPVTCRDRVVAVLTVWGPGCAPALSPILEVVATMLAGAWSAQAQPSVERFDAPGSLVPDRRLRGTISSLLTSETAADGLAAPSLNGLMFLFDNIIDLRYFEQEAQVGRSLSVVRMRTSRHETGIKQR